MIWPTWFCQLRPICAARVTVEFFNVRLHEPQGAGTTKLVLAVAVAVYIVRPQHGRAKRTALQAGGERNRVPQ